MRICGTSCADSGYISFGVAPGLLASLSFAEHTVDLTVNFSFSIAPAFRSEGRRHYLYMRYNPSIGRLHRTFLFVPALFSIHFLKHGVCLTADVFSEHQTGFSGTTNPGHACRYTLCK